MQMIGPYEIRGELGRGAMAVVWRGYDSGIGREVALKEPKIDDSLDPATREELVARFIREGKTAGRLNHPGIVTIYNADIIDGRPVIAMELIEGETLSDLMRRGRLPVGAAVSIAEQLLDALAYAHERGVVHRDVKPDNVFITEDGRVKLTDFGIAHAGGGTALTQAGTVMGTPGYMAPEQVRGEAVDARADLFSVGVMLYEMLAGENPFMADGAHPTTIMYRVLNEALPDVRSTMSEATPGLAATIAVATAKDAGVRFASAGDMRRALLGEVAVAMPKVDRTVPTQRLRLSAAVGIAVLALAGTLVWAIEPKVVQSSGSTPELATGAAQITQVEQQPAAPGPKTVAEAQVDAERLLENFARSRSGNEWNAAGYELMCQAYRDSHTADEFTQDYPGYGHWYVFSVHVEEVDGDVVRGTLAVSDDEYLDDSDWPMVFKMVYEYGSLSLVELVDTAM